MDSVGPIALLDEIPAQSQIRPGGVERDTSSFGSGDVTPVGPIGAAVRHQQLSAPSALRNLATDQIGDVPPVHWRADDIEIVPFSPGAVRLLRQMEPVDFVIESLGAGGHEGRIGARVSPGTSQELEWSTNAGSPAWDFATGPNGNSSATMLQVEQLPFDIGRDDTNQITAAGPAQHLAYQKACPVNAEEHRTDPASAHCFDVDSQRQNGQLPTTHQRHIPRLVQHSFADRQQDDHHAHSEREAQQEKERPTLPNQELTERERDDHSGDAERERGRGMSDAC